MSKPNLATTESSPQEIVDNLCRAAKATSMALSNTTEDEINAVLGDLAKNLRANSAAILAENKKDLDAGKANGLSKAMLDRLALDEGRIDAIASGVETIQDLPDPVGRVLWDTDRPNGLHIKRIAVPIGVLGMIYESRPNVTVDAAALSLKSRNAVVLRGGSESINSSLALHKIIQDTLEAHNIPGAAVSMIPIKDREAVGALLAADHSVDAIIPRGGKGLIARVQEHAKMPVFSHLDGICHVYVHPSAKPEIAVEVPFNAKLRRTGICGSMETLLLDKDLDTDIAKKILAKLLDGGCEIVGDKIVQGLDDRIGAATSEDWRTEYLDSKLSVAVVNGVEEAVEHINTNGSHHTDSILTEDQDTADYFLKNVDSGICVHNASTQFADGGEFGFGAEIGIATGKMHARGPVGLEQLCTYKYQILGTGQTRPS
ncbi:MAG: glutamate-5-semialdehyde dehydrogenase [Alphaproteobacteria bacterium]|nr:glutamate-5-semialdehyde dehydrogenase [Alphaproteobacteria bacterium]